jgi:DNA-binding MarR family transcriptional regulator/GNAT superfamily N-acetyltransferase
MASPSLPASAMPLVRAFSRELARAGGLLSPDYLASGLTVGEARCLYELGHADGLEISALAACVDLDLGHVSRVVSRLAARGLVAKRVGARDARARSVVITRNGARHLAALDQHANQRLAAWLATKPAPAVDQLLGGLRAFTGSAAPRADAAAPRIVVRGPRPGSIGHIIARHGELYVGDLGYPPAFEHYVVQAFGDFMTTFAPPRDRIFLAERDGRFAGSIAVKGLPRATAQLRFLLVEPDARGLGIGRRLVRRVLDHARALGERRVVLDTASDLDAARAIYAAHGFVKTAHRANEPWLPAGVDSERWALDLAAARRVSGRASG